MSYRKRVDGSQTIIVDALRQSGWHVEITSSAGKGFPDLVCAKRGRLVLVELKDPKQPPSKRKLTEDELRVHADFARKGVHIHVLLTIEDALKL